MHQRGPDLRLLALWRVKIRRQDKRHYGAIDTSLRCEGSVAKDLYSLHDSDMLFGQTSAVSRSDQSTMLHAQLPQRLLEGDVARQVN